jgi:hypothetical protein
MKWLPSTVTEIEVLDPEELLVTYKDEIKNSVKSHTQEDGPSVKTDSHQVPTAKRQMQSNND